MSDFERAKLIPVSGTNDTPDMNNAIDVQFNPVTLKVNLSNTLKANQKQGNSRATQFVDKSSSTLTVELIFDTTYIETPEGGSSNSNDPSGNNRIEQGSDVRLQTKKIADKFIKPVESGNQMQAPNRMLFQWGSFEFIGMVQSYDETLDFFSPKGRPLRATVSLKLSEDRYQFRSNDSAALAANQVPTLTFTGNNDDSDDNRNTAPVPGGSDGPGNWRDNAMFNGIEAPRMPGVAALALPGVGLSTGAGFGISGGVGIGLNAGINVKVESNMTAGISAGLSTSVTTTGGGTSGNVSKSRVSKAQGTATTVDVPAPSFRYGNSAVLGTGVPGAFNPVPKAGLNASGLQSGSRRLRSEEIVIGAGGTIRSVTTAGSITRTEGSGAATGRRSGSISVTALLKNKNTSDDGVGFD